MELMVNDHSLHGQFPDLVTFKQALDRMMELRQVAKRYRRELHCSFRLALCQVTSDHGLQEAMAHLPTDSRRAVTAWIGRQGPFWEDAMLHSEDEYYAIGEEVVTERTLGEAAFCRNAGFDRRIVSFTPSNWTRNPLIVHWVHSDDKITELQLPNYWEVTVLASELERAQPATESWFDLESVARAKCPNLYIAEDAFEPLAPHPFGRCPADRILVLLETLNRMKEAFDGNGQRTPQGDELAQKHFVGEKAWFTDSSDGEKVEFKRALTFRHPEKRAQMLFCPWHGKVKTPQIRIHFTYPITADEPLYVVYVGPKITKR